MAEASGKTPSDVDLSSTASVVDLVEPLTNLSLDPSKKPSRNKKAPRSKAGKQNYSFNPDDWKVDEEDVMIPAAAIAGKSILSLPKTTDNHQRRTETSTIATIGEDKAKILSTKVLTYYSTDSQFKRHLESAESLTFYAPPRFLQHRNGTFKYNLFKGWQGYRPIVYPRKLPRLGGTLAVVGWYLDSIRNNLGNDGDIPTIDFISHKGPMVKLASLASPDCRHGVSLEMNVVTYGKHILLSNNSYRDIEGPMSLKFGYLGHKFENVVCSKDWPENGKMPRKEYPMHNNETFKLVMNIELGKKNDDVSTRGTSPIISLAFPSEMDCRLQPDVPIETLSNYAELKTHSSGGSEHSFKRKLFKAYLQANIVGMGEVIIGFRSFSGFLENIVRYKVSDIPDILHKDPKSGEISERLKRQFSPEDSMDWLHSCLEWIKNNIEFGREREVAWRVSYDPKSSTIVMVKIEDPEIVEKITGYVYDDICVRSLDHQTQ
ncbi:hypothetical protein DASC09_009700 [Saccharomycopsis crataegensis]|uniref:Decapping nuclease n=1 Tax=Saccharomycopsis crataegensis TaxID=43959 RepID=A0AAV5QGS0_9ASCO|nr:hypothetical protein DASC09_009700 [Saccharomycopsis crataegensis]